MFSGTPLFAIYECATALERAEASSRVLAARAAGLASAPRAFAELSAIAPEGLIPSSGRGAAHVARQVGRAADLAADARALLGQEVADAVEWAAGITRRIAATSDALDPAGAARAARRGVGTVRGLIASTLDRDERWEAFRIGTHLPRAAWITALIRATLTVNAESGRDDAALVTAAVAGIDPDGSVLDRLLSDAATVASAAHALGEAESALAALHRDRLVGPAALPLAREAQGRRREAAMRTDPHDRAEAVDRLLDCIGALAGAIDPHVAEPGLPPFPGLRRPLSGSPSMT